MGHVCTDINQGALPAMLPFLILAYDLSLAVAATVMLANSVVSAIIQPLFGYLGDKVDRPWFMSLGILLAACGIAAMGFFDSFAAILACALLTGVGVAIFHPEGAKLANVVAGENKGAGISNFSVGGNIGFATGPIIATFALVNWGMHGTVIFLIPAVIAAVILLTQTKAYHRLTDVEHKRISSKGEVTRKDDWVGFSKVTCVNICRSIVGNAILTFIPLYWIVVLGQTQEFGVLILTVYSIGSAVATLIGGRIADRIGFKRMILLSAGTLAPFMLIFLFTFNVVVATALILLCGIAQSLAYSSMIALGQAYLPSRIGMASGISLGVVVSVGGMVSPGIGAIGDTWGLSASMGVACALAFVAVGIALTLFIGRNAQDGIGDMKKKATPKETPN